MLVITPSERNALQLLAQGTALIDLAKCLGVGTSEAATQMNALFTRMGVSNHAEAISVALRRGLLTGVALNSGR